MQSLNYCNELINWIILHKNSTVIKTRGTNIRLWMHLFCYFNTRITRMINSTLGIRFYLHGRFIDRSKTHGIFTINAGNGTQYQASKVLWKLPESVLWWYQTNKKPTELYRDDTFTILESYWQWFLMLGQYKAIPINLIESI